MEVQSEDNLTMCVWPERFRCEKYRVLSSLVDCVVEAVCKRMGDGSRFPRGRELKKIQLKSQGLSPCRVAPSLGNMVSAMIVPAQREVFASFRKRVDKWKIKLMHGLESWLS